MGSLVEERDRSGYSVLGWGFLGREEDGWGSACFVASEVRKELWKDNITT